MCPAATPWAIAGGVSAGALAEGGLEVYRESKTGEYDWRKILIKTLGGSLKGALASSPLKPLATGIAVGASGAIEDYIYCLTCGETHEQALRSAAINGPIEGVTTGGLKFIGNAFANRVKAKPISKPAASTERSSLKPDLQLFAEKVETIWSRIKCTAEKMPGTEIPATFQVDLAKDIKYVNPNTGTNTLWTNANATEHMGEYVSRFGKESWSIGIRSQLMLNSYCKAIDEAMRILITLKPGEHEIICCGWEFAVNTLTGIVYHARLL